LHAWQVPLQGIQHCVEIGTRLHGESLPPVPPGMRDACSIKTEQELRMAAFVLAV
jgi:hypothetical protein